MAPFIVQILLLLSIICGINSAQIYSSNSKGNQLLEGQNEGFERQRRILTPEEEVLADEARAEIAQAIENNLVKIFAVGISQNDDEIYFRQEDDDDIEAVTPNPNVLPQVAQILGAIFSGTLNLTRIADSTFGLVPNLVRNQLQGLVKLLTGENVNLMASSTEATAQAASAESTTLSKDAAVVIEAEDVPTTLAPSVVPSPVPSVATEIGTTGKSRYSIKRKNSTTKGPALAPSSVDDEVVRLERELREAGHFLEPFVQGKEPRVYAGLFNTILANMNMTEVAKAVPTIFKGATQAFTMLENLGVLDALPGGDILEDLDVDAEE